MGLDPPPETLQKIDPRNQKIEHDTFRFQQVKLPMERQMNSRKFQKALPNGTLRILTQNNHVKTGDP